MPLPERIGIVVVQDPTARLNDVTVKDKVARCKVSLLG